MPVTDLPGPDLIEIGRVGKPHGVRGGFHLDGAIDAAALKPGLVLFVADRKLTVSSRGGMDAKPLISVEEISDRDEIASLRGEAVFAARGDLSPLAEGEYFAADLFGLTVCTEEGKELGAVVRLVNAPSVDILEVGIPDGDDLLIPMVADAIISISPADGKITINATFLDLN